MPENISAAYEVDLTINAHPTCLAFRDQKLHLKCSIFILACQRDRFEFADMISLNKYGST